jgi:hypothetical protein
MSAATTRLATLAPGLRATGDPVDAGLAALITHPRLDELLRRFDAGATLFAIDDAGCELVVHLGRQLSVNAIALQALFAALTPKQVAATLRMFLEEIDRVRSDWTPPPEVRARIEEIEQQAQTKEKH